MVGGLPARASGKILFDASTNKARMGYFESERVGLQTGLRYTKTLRVPLYRKLCESLFALFLFLMGKDEEKGSTPDEGTSRILHPHIPPPL
jgi:hypothetical protein